MSESETDPRALLRHLPGTDRVLEELAGCAEEPPAVTAEAVRTVLQRLRERLLAGERVSREALAVESVAARAREHLALEGPLLPRVLNATGVVLHSGLGRAPLPEAATAAVEVAARYSLLEVDREDAHRRSRDHRLVELLRLLTGAEDAFVVNNNAAATLLILTTLAAGKDVICSRGEMVEIGGSYRIPDVMEASGARLVSVGTTNRTRIADYERAITENTGALLVVHTSNYRIVGFTEAPELSEVVALGRAHGLPVVHDLGSGSLLSQHELGLGDEPPVSHSLDAGADVVCWSGDKLLGGPQAGIILGREDLVGAMRRNHLARALRVDKMCVAALAATLRLYLDRPRLEAEHPVLRMLRTPADELRPRAEALRAAAIDAGVPTDAVEVVACHSETGSGALPTLQIPSMGVACRAPEDRASALARRLRMSDPGLFTRIADGRVLLDLRTLFPGEESEAARVLARGLRSFA